jgi:short-subunit dehydrogenase
LKDGAIFICKVSLAEMDYFSRKSLSKYLIDTIDFNKHDINIIINNTGQKYAGDYSKLQGDFFAHRPVS